MRRRGEDFEADKREQTRWYLALWLSPPLVLAGVVFISSVFHVFDNVPLVGQQLTWQQASLVLGAIFGPAMAGCFCHLMWNRARARVSRNWPQAEGRIEASRIYEYQDWLMPWRRVCRLKIAYRYTVDARDYVGHRVQFGSQVVPPEIGDTLAVRFAVGAHVPVHYDLKDPGDAVLDCSDQMASFRNMGMIWYFLSVYALFVVMVVISTAMN